MTSSNGHGRITPTTPTVEFTEIRSAKRSAPPSADDIANTPGMFHPVTGDLLTIGQAIALRILDVRSGRIHTEDGPPLTIDGAAEKGLITRSLADKLLGELFLHILG